MRSARAAGIRAVRRARTTADKAARGLTYATGRHTLAQLVASNATPLQHRQIPLHLKIRHVPAIVVVFDRLVLQQALEHVIAERPPREVALTERLDRFLQTPRQHLDATLSPLIFA